MSNRSAVTNIFVFSFILIAAIFTVVKHEQYSMAILHGIVAIIVLTIEFYECLKRKKAALIKLPNV